MYIDFKESAGPKFAADANSILASNPNKTQEAAIYQVLCSRFRRSAWIMLWAYYRPNLQVVLGHLSACGIVVGGLSREDEAKFRRIIERTRKRWVAYDKQRKARDRADDERIRARMKLRREKEREHERAAKAKAKAREKARAAKARAAARGKVKARKRPVKPRASTLTLVPAPTPVLPQRQNATA